jgi:flagellar basal-body rod protein FlgB
VCYAIEHNVRQGIRTAPREIEMSIGIDKALGIHQPALLLRSRRAGLLAENVANADTPNYKARDVDFRAELERAWGEGERSGVRLTHARHMPAARVGPGGLEPLYRVPEQPSVDGNTVDTQREKAAFLDNAMRYQASLTFLGAKIQTLRTALQGDR